MDWKEDDWFAAYHADKLTDEFKKWWMEKIGDHEGWPDDDVHEYWVRCGWCRLAWEAGHEVGYVEAY